jgi:hypothetical protein
MIEHHIWSTSAGSSLTATCTRARCPTCGYSGRADFKSQESPPLTFEKASRPPLAHKPLSQNSACRLGAAVPHRRRRPPRRASGERLEYRIEYGLGGLWTGPPSHAHARSGNDSTFRRVFDNYELHFLRCRLHALAIEGALGSWGSLLASENNSFANSENGSARKMTEPRSQRASVRPTGACQQSRYPLARNSRGRNADGPNGGSCTCSLI